MLSTDKAVSEAEHVECRASGVTVFMHSPVADSGSAEQGPSTSSVVVRGNTIRRDDNAC